MASVFDQALPSTDLVPIGDSPSNNSSGFNQSQPSIDLLAAGHTSLNDGIPKQPYDGLTQTFNSLAYKGNPLYSPKYSHSQVVNTTIGSDGATKPERLYQVIPRYAVNDSDPSKGYNTAIAGGDRGTPAGIRLVSDADPMSKRTNLDSDVQTTVAQIIKDMTEDGFAYTDFLLTDVQVQMNEKVQISEVFGDTEVVYYFGKQPVMFNLSGIVIDDKSNNWFTKFLYMYSNIGRGSELARNGELIEIMLPNMVVMGSISGLTYSQNAQRDTDIQFNMQIIAKRIKPVGAAPLTGPITNNNLLMTLSPDSSFRDMSQINAMKNYIAKLSTGASGTTGGIMGALSGLAALPGQISNFFGGLTKQAGNFMNSLFGGMLGNGSMMGFRGSLFSPVYGFLSSITKIIQSVFGGLSSLIHAFTDPVKNILRDIRNISSMAQGIVNAVEGGIESLINIPKSLANDFRQTIISLKNTVGCISRAPRTIADILRDLQSASLRNAAFLNAGKKAGLRKVALLGSGVRYSPIKGAQI